MNTIIDDLVMLERLTGTTNPKGLQEMREIITRVHADTFHMLAALKQLRDELSRHVNVSTLSASNGDREVFIYRMREADRVIAKAEGRS